MPVILGEIKKLFRDGGTVKVSRSIKELGLKVTAERERLMKLTGAEPTVAQLAQNLGATPEQVAVSIQAAMPVVSLTPADDEDGTREYPGGFTGRSIGGTDRFGGNIETTE